jgi:hypothetical protein
MVGGHTVIGSRERSGVMGVWLIFLINKNLKTWILGNQRHKKNIIFNLIKNFFIYQQQYSRHCWTSQEAPSRPPWAEACMYSHWMYAYVPRIAEIHVKELVNQNLFFVQWLVATLLLALGNGVVSWGTPPMSSRVLQLYVGENDGGGSLTCISAILGTYAYIQWLYMQASAHGGRLGASWDVQQCREY